MAGLGLTDAIGQGFTGSPESDQPVNLPDVLPRGQVDLPAVDPNQHITISATRVQRWVQGAYEVFVLEGSCEIEQGPETIHSKSAVIWLERSSEFSLTPHQMIVYVEGANVEFVGDDRTDVTSRIEAESWHTRLQTYQPIRFAFALPESIQPEPLPEIYDRGRAIVFPYDVGSVQPAQFTSPFFQGTLPGQTPGQIVPPAFVPGSSPPAGPRRLGVFPRSSNSLFNSTTFKTEDGSQYVTVVDSGVNIVLTGMTRLGTVDISTDRVVIWSPAGGGGLAIEGGGASGSGTAVEFYMEGNIVFRQADRVIYAKSMYYNVQQESGVILDAELITGIPQYDGVLRLRADVMRQLDSSRFQASNAALTSSRLGVPSYWFQSGDLQLEDNTQPAVDPLTGAPIIDPATGEQAIIGQRLATSRNNVVYLGEIPVFFWPTLSTDLVRPTTYVNRVRLGNDRVFGTQIGFGVDLHQLTGLGTRFPGTDWSGTIDYLSDRGVGFGTTFDYVLNQFLGIPGEARGFFDAWGIDDRGTDNLGADRRRLTPEEDFRGRVLWQHRQRTLNGVQITAELGLISDRNFLEQYYEREWDQWKDQSTGIELKYLTGTESWNLTTDFRLNDFFTQTEWLPRLDHFQLGRSLFQDRVTWFGHNQLGYGKLKTASTPVDPADLAKSNPLAWEVEREGVRTGARHELDLPLNVGGWKVVPYVLGEVMHWGEAIDGDSTTRLFGQVGFRTSVPFWSVDPTIRDELFNLNGLAHKVVFESEFFWADANKNLDEFPLYDPLDDDAAEHFRRRFVDDQFGGVLFVNDLVPLRFDERFYALRTGLQSWVTSPSAEIADDLMLMRVSVRQRWQTKRGLAGRERVVDWMTLDMGGTFFPKAGRDNFGEDFGLFNYDWRWHVGDRVTLMSDGRLDTFSDGLAMFNVGGYISRPERGSAYLGFRSIEGPISSSVLNAAMSYRMSQKWIASVGAAIDFGPTGNIGQLFELTRIGESFLVSFGANIDASRNNVGIRVLIEPRFLPTTFRGLGGVGIPAVGSTGLE